MNGEDNSSISSNDENQMCYKHASDERLLLRRAGNSIQLANGRWCFCRMAIEHQKCSNSTRKYTANAVWWSENAFLCGQINYIVVLERRRCSSYRECDRDSSIPWSSMRCLVCSNERTLPRVLALSSTVEYKHVSNTVRRGEFWFTYLLLYLRTTCICTDCTYCTLWVGTILLSCN